MCKSISYPSRYAPVGVMVLEQVHWVYKHLEKHIRMS